MRMRKKDYVKMFEKWMDKESNKLNKIMQKDLKEWKKNIPKEEADKITAKITYQNWGRPL